MSDPTTCDRCGASLERGWCKLWSDGTLLESICFGCNDAEHIKLYRETKVLTSTVTVMASIDKVHREYDKPCATGNRELLIAVWASCAKIFTEIKAWERAVWFGGLQAAVRAAKFRGFRLDFPGGSALVYSIAAQTQITIETTDGSAQITLITAEDETQPVMCQNSIRATEDQALGLLAALQKAFVEGAKFQRDDKIGLGL